MTKKQVISSKLRPWLTESGLLTIQGWARDGLTNQDIAHNCGVTPKTLYAWINAWPEIEEALRLGKVPSDRKVESSLFKRANGYTEVIRKTKVTNQGDIIPYTEEVHYPPDTTAAIFWLKNRKPEDWRDKQEVEHTGTVDNPIKINITKVKDD